MLYEVITQGGVITAEDIQLQGESTMAIEPIPAAPAPDTFNTLGLKHLERDYIQDLLQRHQGHRRLVAEQMGISERTLYRKLQRYGLK